MRSKGGRLLELKEFPSRRQNQHTINLEQELAHSEPNWRCHKPIIKVRAFAGGVFVFSCRFLRHLRGEYKLFISERLTHFYWRYLRAEGIKVAQDRKNVLQGQRFPKR